MGSVFWDCCSGIMLSYHTSMGTFGLGFRVQVTAVRGFQQISGFPYYCKVVQFKFLNSPATEVSRVGYGLMIFSSFF